MKSKFYTIAVPAIATLVASLPLMGESSPLLKKPVMKFPTEIETYGPVDVMVSKKLQGAATGDDIYVNIPTQQTIRHKVKRNPAISYFRLQNDFFNRMLCEEECIDEPRLEEFPLEDIIPVPYLFMNTTAGTPSVLGATRGNRNFDIRYQALDGGNITGKLVRAAYKVNITTESDVIIRQSVKPTRTSRFRSASTTATLRAMIDSSIFDDRIRSSSKAKGSSKDFLDGSAVVVSKEAEQKKRKKKPRRPRRPTNLF